MALEKKDRFGDLKILDGADIHRKYIELGGYGIFLGRESADTIGREAIAQKLLANWVDLIEKGLILARDYELGKFIGRTDGTLIFMTRQKHEDGSLCNYVKEYDKKEIIYQIEQYEKNGKHTKG